MQDKWSRQSLRLKPMKVEAREATPAEAAAGTESLPNRAGAPSTQEGRKWILVTGSSRSLAKRHRSLAARIGEQLARGGYGLVVGDWKGVDQIAAQEFLRNVPEPEWALRCRQVVMTSLWSRLSFRPRWRAEGAQMLVAKGRNEEYEKAAQACDAAIVVGGLGGARRTALRVREQGKPVLPFPFSKGDSADLFRDLMEGWDDDPLPGLKREQVLELYSIPGTHDAVETVMRLLDIALQDEQHTFISYRREDVPFAAGRVYDALARRFGARAVFMDWDDLRPGESFPPRIEATAEQCRVMVAVIGPEWLQPDEDGESRLADNDDYVRRELLAAREGGEGVARIVPLVIGTVDINELRDGLPEELRWLVDECNMLQILDNARWAKAMEALSGEVRRSINPGLAR